MRFVVASVKSLDVCSGLLCSLTARATNPILRAAAEPAADQLRKEADEKAAVIISEAEKRADGVVAEAQRQASQGGLP